jgi:deoxyhypusine synthase
VSWGKVDPEALSETVVCYLDGTVGLPLLTAYALANHPPRKHKRLYDRRDDMLDSLRRKYKEAQ